ncbi:hypothetical protein KO02_12340 [Sphingobacterium sp. ML3W]|uniref:hypothetical protein n=1 Tax=Sphingobacterium sp. ML3W TaxID=1538644 RepID=UPI0004F91315|nr:hypothetical protein [Sphingobacterium sp. ML3W]AIM37392.1 hypothetical protein KO02_12340 [Sphingobacterium sp. ML3W]
MSWNIHHTIIVTDWDSRDIEKARALALEYIDEILVTPIFYGYVNPQYTFFIVPDGSKEGWLDSDIMDTNRALFLNKMKESDLCCDYVELQFGGDFGSELTQILRHGDSDLNKID